MSKFFILFFSFHVFIAFYATFPKFVEQNTLWGCKHDYFSFHVFFTFLLFVFFLGNIEKCPFTYWLNGRWFFQMVDREF